jgi:bacteriorhodopsin
MFTPLRNNLIPTFLFFIPMFLCSAFLANVDTSTVTMSPNIKKARDAGIVFITFYCLLLVLGTIEYIKFQDESYDITRTTIRVILYLILFGSYLGVMSLLYKDASTINKESNDKTRKSLNSAMIANGFATSFLIIVVIWFLYFTVAKPMNQTYNPDNFFDFIWFEGYNL